MGVVIDPCARSVRTRHDRKAILRRRICIRDEGQPYAETPSRARAAVRSVHVEIVEGVIVRWRHPRCAAIDVLSEPIIADKAIVLNTFCMTS